VALMTGGLAPKRKGYCFERECVNDARTYGLECSRVPLSGAGEEKGDIRLHTGFGDLLKGEAKRRKKLADWIVNALGEHDFLIMREDRGETYVLIRSKLFFELCQ
jgi:Holliday junction resolvase